MGHLEEYCRAMERGDVEAVVGALSEDVVLHSPLTRGVRPAAAGRHRGGGGLGPRVAARKGRAQALAAAAMLKPLALLTRVGDRAGVRLIGG